MITSPSNKAWLKKTVEQSIDPERPICDPHHHLWEFRDERVAHRYLLNEILEDVNAGHNIVATVFIECGAMYKSTGRPEMQVLGEVEFVNGIAAMSASGLYGGCNIAAGIVGSADLTLGSAVGEVLDALTTAGGGRFRGIRHQGAWDASDAIPNGRHNFHEHAYLNPQFRAGFAELGKRGLSFEGWCYHPMIKDLTELARAFPETTIIVNHFGGPLGVGPYAGKRDSNFTEWKRDFAELATCPNVVAKLGGLNMELNGFDWHLADAPPSSETLMQATRHYYDYALEVFGPARCMFESNFPVDMVSCSYNVLWNSFKRLSADFSEAEKSMLFLDTAMRVYRLSTER